MIVLQLAQNALIIHHYHPGKTLMPVPVPVSQIYLLGVYCNYNGWNAPPIATSRNILHNARAVGTYTLRVSSQKKRNTSPSYSFLCVCCVKKKEEKVLTKYGGGEKKHVKMDKLVVAVVVV